MCRATSHFLEIHGVRTRQLEGTFQDYVGELKFAIADEDISFARNRVAMKRNKQSVSGTYPPEVI
jgi:hypothetical protein